jgi:ABC-2 type transport system permease protein
MYGLFGGMFVAFGVMIIMQRVLISEKNSGTAAWVLSKPVTRTAFVVSRLVVNSIAILLTSVIVPGVIFYITLGLFSDFGWLSPSVSAALAVPHTFYWIALVLMMGTLVESSGVVIGVPMALFFFFWMGTGMVPALIYISPLLLTFSPAPEQMNALSVSFMIGEPVFSWLPLISTIVFCFIFIAVAIRRFNRQEF